MKTKRMFRSPVAFRLFLAFFLEQEGCRRQFIRNLEVLTSSSFSDYCLKVFNSIGSNGSCLELAITGAFVWSSTPECDEFWNRVHRHWLNILVLK